MNVKVQWILLGSLLAFSCAIPKDRRCEESDPATCEGTEGNELRFCNGGVISVQTCANGTICDETAKACVGVGGPFCGDGNIDADAGETCDNGATNGDPGDDCNGDCTNVECGDGITGNSAGEECDDGNNIDTDNCTNDCKVNVASFCGDGNLNAGEACDNGAANGTTGNACNDDCTAARCGDGITGNFANEQCDDGNTVDTDNCKNNCTLNGAPTFCGDNVIQAPETCDNGINNGTLNNACNDDCTLARCGDGITGNSPNEQCDDGNNNDIDACGNDCKVNIAPGCGNNIQEGAETCDDGNNQNGDGCDANCTLPACGNGLTGKDAAGNPEQCDDGNQIDNDGCRNNCRLPVCGDSAVQGVEQCDDGNQNNADACINNCQNARCGDNLVQQGVEDCDDGNNLNGDSCNADCTNAGCGDGVIQSGEDCDDNNTVSGDGCDATCFFENNGVVCGDGFTEGAEQCDDNNTISGDGCNAVCLLEDTCGDGNVDVVVFSALNQIAAGNGSTKTGDFNGDGFQDLIAIDGSTASAFVSFGAGDGTFAAPIVSSAPNTFFSFEVGDINNDGFDDVVGGDLIINSVFAFLSNGNGTFTAQAATGIGAGPRFMELTDVNRDGKLDAINANIDGGNTTVSFGNGTGTFSAALFLGSGHSPHAVAVADFNNDNIPDIVEANLFDNGISVLLQNANGSFQAGRFSTFGAPNGPDTIAAGDINGDGRQDTAATISSGIVLSFGLGDGFFAAPVIFSFGAGAGGQVEITDLNDDGFDDVVTSKAGEDKLHIFFGTAQGVRNDIQIPSGSQSNVISFADFNSDGNIDISSKANANLTNVHFSLSTPNEECDDANSINNDGCESNCRLICGNGSGAFGASFDPNTGNCYLGFIDQDLSWFAAEASCESMGGYLTVIDSAQENTLARQTTPLIEGPWIGFINNILNNVNAFLFNKISGGKLTFNGFNQAVFPQPDGSSPGLNCVHFFGSGAFTGVDANAWDDTDCNDVTFNFANSFICEIEPATCGDGVTQTSFGEECDDANSINGDSCENDCTAPRCGNGIEDTNELCFVPPSTLNATGGDVVVFDLDQDGFEDIIAADNNSSTVSLLFGDGLGGFSQQTFAAGGTALSTAVADFNEDGLFDLITGNVATNDVGLFIGLGNRLFGTPVIVASNFIGPRDIIAADFDNDGHQDAAIAALEARKIVVLFGNGDGTFDAPLVLSVGQTIAVNTGDFNGDGLLDLVSSNFLDNSLNILINQGNGTISNGITIATSVHPRMVKTADFNNDGKIDIFVPFELGQSLGVFLGNGNGTFQGEINTPAGVETHDAVITDLNADGKLDVIVTSFVAGELRIFFGNGNGTFQPPTVIFTGLPVFAIDSGDFNRDGLLDITTAQGALPVEVFFGLGADFTRPTRLPSGSAPGLLVLEDLNNDGLTDLIVPNRNDNVVAVRLGLGGGSFSAQTTFDIGPECFGVTVGDVNRDGILDIVGGNFSSSTVSVLLGTAAGGFQNRTTFAAGNSPIDTAIGDLDRDGKLDIAVLNFNVDTVSILKGNGNGSFNLVGTLSTSDEPRSIALDDFDNDGILDISVAAFATGAAGFVNIFLGNGDLTFASSPQLSAGLGPQHVSTGDLNGDGKADLVVANALGNNVSVFIGVGNGTFLAAPSLSTSAGAFGVDIADVNGDGALDIVNPASAANLIDVHLGKGDGTFLGRQSFPAGLAPIEIATGDINGDGLFDIATANQNSGDVTLLFNFFE
jgi:cysteine-rich repeat protein